MSEDNSEHEITLSTKRRQVVEEYEQDKGFKIVIEPIPVLDEIFADEARCELNQYLNSISDKLPDQRMPEVNQKQDFIIKQKLIKDIMAKAKDAAKQAVYHERCGWFFKRSRDY